MSPADAHVCSRHAQPVRLGSKLHDAAQKRIRQVVHAGGAGASQRPRRGGGEGGGRDCLGSLVLGLGAACTRHGCRWGRGRQFRLAERRGGSPKPTRRAS